MRTHAPVPATAAALLAFLMLCPPGTPSAQAQPFTYQGRLSQNGQPANGLYEFHVTVTADAAGQQPVGAPVEQSVPVADGLFTLDLDVGAGGVFTGAERWLEIRVRAPGDAEATLLLPRQRVTPAPYAVRALNERLVPVGPPAQQGTVRLDPASRRLVINNTREGNAADGLSVYPVPPQNLNGAVGVYAAAGGTEASFAYGRDTGHRARLVYSFNNEQWSVRISGNTRLTVNADGRVGVGTAAPQARLDVAGEARAQAYTYAAPQTRHLGLPAGAFIPRQAANAVVEAANGSSYYNLGQGAGTFSAPVVLPAGAVITEVRVFLLHTAPASTMTVSLVRRGYEEDAFTTLATGASAPGVPQVQSIVVTPLPDPYIAVEHVYSLVITSPNWQGPATAIKGARITYTVPGPG